MTPNTIRKRPHIIRRDGKWRVVPATLGHLARARNRSAYLAVYLENFFPLAGR